MQTKTETTNEVIKCYPKMTDAEAARQALLVELPQDFSKPLVCMGGFTLSEEACQYALQLQGATPDQAANAVRLFRYPASKKKSQLLS